MSARVLVVDDVEINVKLLAAKLSSEPADGLQIPIRITSKTKPEAQALVCAFWQRLGYEPVVEMDSAEAMLR